MRVVVDKNKWLRGNAGISFLCDESNNYDILGCFLLQRGVNADLLRNEVDPLELLYKDVIDPEDIKELLIQVDLKDSAYPGLHWNLKPEVSDMMLVNDAGVGDVVSLSTGRKIIEDEFVREAELVYIFSKLGITLVFED